MVRSIGGKNCPRYIKKRINGSFFYIEPTPASFSLFSFSSTTILRKIVDFSGIQTRIFVVKESTLTTWPPPRASNEDIQLNRDFSHFCWYFIRNKWCRIRENFVICMVWNCTSQNQSLSDTSSPTVSVLWQSPRLLHCF